jgi:putative hemolysin
MPSPLELLTIALILALNGVLAAYEMALSAASHARLLALERAGVRGAAAAVFMKSRIERSLAVVQLGITLLAAVAGAFGGLSVEERLAPVLEERLGFSPAAADAIALACIVIPLSALTIVFAELVPKVLAIRHRERVCCVLSPTMKLVASVVAPVVGVFERVVKGVVGLLTRARRGEGLGARDETSLHEMTAAAALARTAKLLGAREERIVRSAALLSSRELGEIELPAADISMLGADMTLEAALVHAHLDMHTRFPVARAEGDPQTIEGYVTFKDLVALLKMTEGRPTLRAAMRPIHRLRRTLPIAAALDQMVRERTHIALVVDAADRVTGMVTLEDILEELVGDIEDEFDRLPAHVQPAGDGFIVGGGILLETLAKKTGMDLAAAGSHAQAARPAAAAAEAKAAGAGGPAAGTAVAPPAGSTTMELARPPTLADWLVKELGRPPRGGEMIALSGLTLSVRKLRRKKLSEAFLRRTDAAAAAGATA